MQLLGWPGVLPLSAIRSVGLAIGEEEPLHRAGVSAISHLIGEALGILVCSRRLSEDHAFDVLRRYSQDTNVKLREVARRVTERRSI